MSNEHLFYYRLNRALPYATEDELSFLRELPLDQYNNIVMIGAGPGIMALAMLEGKAIHPTFTIIDWDQNNIDYTKSHLRSIHVDYVRCILSDSAFASEHFQDDSIDLLIVDGDHSKRGVLRDIDAWWGKIKIGGMLFFHDYLERPTGFRGDAPWKLGGVAQAIAELLADGYPLNLVDNVGISAVYRKMGVQVE